MYVRWFKAILPLSYPWEWDILQRKGRDIGNRKRRTFDKSD